MGIEFKIIPPKSQYWGWVGEGGEQMEGLGRREGVGPGIGIKKRLFSSFKKTFLFF